MKKSITYWFMMLLILLVASFALINCTVKKPLQTSTVETNDKSTVSDSKETVTINREILDQMFFNISKIKSSNPDCDSLINYYREELARSIASSKDSGDNGYEIKYNEALQQLQILMKLGQTQNKDKSNTIHTENNHTYYKEIEVPVNVHFMHWWEKMFMRIGQICSGLAGLFLVYFIIKSKVPKI
jgi:hypothetical protein